MMDSILTLAKTEGMPLQGPIRHGLEPVGD
jgi:hypothetical protein